MIVQMGAGEGGGDEGGDGDGGEDGGGVLVPSVGISRRIVLG
jgi:hypothetical protein